MQCIVVLDIKDRDRTPAGPRVDVPRQTPSAWCPAIHGQNDCLLPTKSEGRSGRGVETTRNSIIASSQLGSAANVVRRQSGLIFKF